MPKPSTLIPNNFVAISSQLTPPFLLRLSQLRVSRLHFISCGFADFVPEKITFLNHKIPVFTDFLAVVPLHGLVKRKAVPGNAALGAVAR